MSSRQRYESHVGEEVPPRYVCAASADAATASSSRAGARPPAPPSAIEMATVAPQ